MSRIVPAAQTGRRQRAIVKISTPHLIQLDLLEIKCTLTKTKNWLCMV